MVATLAPMGWGLLVLMAVALLVLVWIGTAVLVYTLVHPPRRTAGVAMARGEPTDPVEAGAPSYETHALVSADGSHLELWEIPGQAPGGPTLIMLHGWGDGRLGELLWLDVLRPIASRLILFDLRGHGECPPGRCGWGLVEIDDALAVIDWARLRGKEPVVLFGYSMGAAIAIGAAVRAASSVAAVIADSPYQSIGRAVRGTMRIQRLPTWPVATLGLAWLRWRGALPADDDLTALASRLTVPLLVLHGSADGVTPLCDARQIAAAAPMGSLVEFASCNHVQAAGAEPERYTAAVRQFLENEKGPAHKDCGTEPFRGQV